MSRPQGVRRLSQLGRLLFWMSFHLKCERNLGLKVSCYHGPFRLSMKWRPRKNVHFSNKKIKKKPVIVWQLLKLFSVFTERIGYLWLGSGRAEAASRLGWRNNADWSSRRNPPIPPTTFFLQGPSFLQVIKEWHNRVMDKTGPFLISHFAKITLLWSPVKGIRQNVLSN